MFYLKYLKSIMLVLISAVILTTSNVCMDKATAQSVVTPVKPTVAAPVVSGQADTKPLDVVKNPSAYLNKTVKMDATFDKFATLGLDYKSAMRSSEEYISFLILREDTEHAIPLSEMKLFLKRELAEKHIDLKTNDRVFITGNVFSDALGDPWIDVIDLYITEKAPEKDGVNK